jgi:hypothetical protein
METAVNQDSGLFMAYYGLFRLIPAYSITPRSQI